MQDESFRVNSKSYWDRRFGSGDWGAKGGFSQTRLFAESQIEHLNIPKDFSGTILDFGCGAGDAFPVYRKKYPSAQLVGVDFSSDAIKLCDARYGKFGKFICTESKDLPTSDVIICSNVMEHLSNDKEVICDLIGSCKVLYVIVPYMEFPLSPEHVRQYNEFSFSEFHPASRKVILSKGWSKYGTDLWYHVYLKNILRFAAGERLVSQNKQIIFEFKGAVPTV